MAETRRENSAFLLTVVNWLKMNTGICVIMKVIKRKILDYLN